MSTTSDGLKEFLIRQGIKPTGDSDTDKQLARPFFPPSFKKKKKSDEQRK